MKSFKKILAMTLLASSVVITSVQAGEDWYVSATVGGMGGNYSSSEQRDNLYSGNLLLNADYLDNFSFALAYNNLALNFKDTGAGKFAIKQNAFAGRLQYHFYSDSLNGKLTVQLVAHTVSNDDVTGFSDNVEVISPKIAYLNFSKDLYLDLEYTKSKYTNTTLTVDQIVPSIGFGFNDKADWLRLKVYYIQTSDADLSQGEDSLTSVDIRWTHWFAPDAVLGINNFFADVLAGERIFAVDNDSFSVYNLADVQQGSFLLGLGWKFGDDLDLVTIAGVEKYENKIIKDKYNQQYVYVGLTKHW